MSGESDARLVRLEEELARTRGELLHIRRASRARKFFIAPVFIGAILITGWAASADTGIRGGVVNDPLVKMNQRMAALEQRLQAKIDGLESRVRRLELKPDNVDNDDAKKESGHKANAQEGGSPANASEPAEASGSGQSIFSLIQRVTALERRTSFRAPFMVTDSKGGALFTVTENGMRGVKIFSNGVPRVTLEAKNEGGEIEALAPNLGMAGLSATETVNEVFVTGPTGGKALRIAGSSEGGMIAVGSHDGKTAVLGSDKGPIGLRFYSTPQEGTLLGGMGVLADGSTGVSLRTSEGDQTVRIGSASGTAHGFIQTFDKGTLRAEMEANDKGLITVRNSSGNAVAFLTESSQGQGGNITLADPAGNGIVSAGYGASDQGDVCLDRKKHLYCVGVNLPLSISH